MAITVTNDGIVYSVNLINPYFKEFLYNFYAFDV